MTHKIRLLSSSTTTSTNAAVSSLIGSSVGASIALSAAIALIASPAMAADQALLDILLSNGAIDQAQYNELLSKEALEEADVVNIGFANGSGLNVKSADGAYEVEIGGRLHLDYIDHSFDSRIGKDPISGSQVRRGRIEIDGVFDNNWGYAAEFDYAKNKVAIKDIKLGYETDSGASLYVGHQKQPYSLSLEMSSNDIPFVERSADNYLVATFTDRAIGARYENSGANWFVAAGIFGDAMSNSDTSGDEGWGTSGRLVYSPIIEDERILHLGVRGSYREVDIATPTMQIKDKTTDFSGLSIVNTGALNDAESATLFGPEMAAVWGPLYVFAEHTTTQVGRTAAPDLEFSGWHAAAAWSLTGESRASRYSMSSGEFKGLRPAKSFDWANGGIGAWEIAARYAAIDLNDGNVMGGTEDALSIALNWYPNRSVRIMADWSRVLDTDESNTIRMFAQDMDIFTLRTQWNF